MANNFEFRCRIPFASGEGDYIELDFVADEVPLDSEAKSFLLLIARSCVEYLEKLPTKQDRPATNGPVESK